MGKTEGRIVYIGGLTESEVELAEYSIVSQIWAEFGQGTTPLNKQVIIQIYLD